MARRIVRPIFVVGSPRSGTTLLQHLLCRDPSVYRLGRESRFLWHRLGGQEMTGSFPAVGRIEEAYLSEVYVGERTWEREPAAETVVWWHTGGTLGLPRLLEDLQEA